jgi:peptidyl-tRNA hydrolase
MKESTLLDMKKKIESIGRILQHLINETTHLRELSVGTLEALKLMPGYDEAIEQLKESLTNKEEEKDGAVKQDTK